ncbi:type II toxin-antitoxin system RnlB family antitoxin [Priestia megaterium]
MNSYIIQTNSESAAYGFVIYSVSYVSPIQNLKPIGKELRHVKFKGKVLFDLLLCNGLASNRFIEVEFTGFNFKFDSFKVIEASEEQREQSARFYKNNEALLNRGILPDAIQFLIKKGKVV